MITRAPKVRGYNHGRNPVLFKVNMGAGHAGESGRFESQKLTASFCCLISVYIFSAEMVEAFADGIFRQFEKLS